MECDPEERAGHRAENSIDCEAARKKHKLSNLRWAHVCTSSASRSCFKNQIANMGSTWICLILYASFLSTWWSAIHPGEGEDVCLWQSLLSFPWSPQMENAKQLSPCLPCATAWAGTSLPSCHPRGGAGSRIPQAPHPKALVQERMGWSCTDSIARTESSKEMLSAYIWKHGYLICPFFAPIFIASCLNYTNEVFSCLVPRDSMH